MDSTNPPDPGPDGDIALPHFEARLLEALRIRHQALVRAQPADPRDLPPVDGTRRAAGSPVSSIEPRAVDTTGNSRHQIEEMGPKGRGRSLSPRARSPRTRRPAGRPRKVGRRSLAVGVALTVVGVAAIAIVERRDSEVAAPPQGTPTSGQETSTVETRMVAAIDEALANSVIHTVQENSFTSGTHESWYDEQTGASRSLARGGNGQPVLDVGPTTAPGVDDRAPDVSDLEAEGAVPADPRWPRASMRHVDHCFATYADVEEPVLPGGGGEAARTRDGLADGSMVTDGTEVVEGRELIRVVAGPQQPPATGGGSPSEGTSTVPVVPPPQGAPTTIAAPDDTVTYVDPDTYRPVMVVNPGMYTQRLEYLPRTAENLALLAPPVPEGFTLTGTLHGDRERLEANCS